MEFKKELQKFALLRLLLKKKKHSLRPSLKNQNGVWSIKRLKKEALILEFLLFKKRFVTYFKGIFQKGHCISSNSLGIAKLLEPDIVWDILLYFLGKKLILLSKILIYDNHH